MFWRRQQERDLRDELEFHLAQLGGEGTDFGGADRAAEECRDGRRGAWLDGLWRDLAQAARGLRRQPGWSLALVGMLALGIGATTAVFGLVQAALLRPLPYRRADQLVWISGANAKLGLSGTALATPSNLAAWRPDLQRLFSETGYVTRGGQGEPWRIGGVARVPYERGASANFFPMLGVRPWLGRTFTPADFASGTFGVAVLSYRYWRAAFGGDPRAVGTVVSTLQGRPRGITIVGVLPPQFRLAQDADLWVPATPPHTTQEFRVWEIVGRRRAGVSEAGVRAAMGALMARNPPPRAVLNGGGPWTAQVEPLAAHVRGKLRTPLLLLLGAVGCLWLLACVNAANLVMARARQRRRELGVRLALGCSRARLARHLLLDAALPCVVGGALGWLLGAAALQGLAAFGEALFPPDVWRSLGDLRASGAGAAGIAYALALALVAVALVGLGPALRARRLATGDTARPAQPLAALAVALSTVLAVGAGLLGHSFATLATAERGFESRGRISFQLSMPTFPCVYARTCTARDEVGAIAVYMQAIMDRLRQQPGVRSAAISLGVPLEGAYDDPAALQAPRTVADVFPTIVSAGFFRTLGVPIVAGRGFGAPDRPGASKSVIVNQAFVRRFLPGIPPIGHVVQLPRCGPRYNPDHRDGCEIVGVAGDMRSDTLARPPYPAAYLALSQDATFGGQFLVDSSLPGADALRAVRRVIAALPPLAVGGANGANERPYVFAPRTLDATIAASIATPRFRAWLSGALALLSLLLAAVGIFGVQAYAVARRVREIGVRMAVGASGGDIACLVLGSALRWTLAGTVAGLAVAALGARVLAGALFDVRAWDAATYLGVPLVLAATALLAAWLPARRAARVDPVTALRVE